MRRRDAVRKIRSSQTSAPTSGETTSTAPKSVLDQGLRKRFWGNEKRVRREIANIKPLG